MTWGSQNTEEEAHEQLDKFVEMGGTFIDVAELYPVPPDAKYTGQTEEIIGNWLEKHPELRSKCVIATKVAGPHPFNFIPANREKTLTGVWDDNAVQPRLVPDQINRAVAASLKRLKTTYIDLYQLHWPDRYTPLWGSNQYKKELEGKHQQQERADPHDRVDFDEVVRCMGTLIKDGLIRSWGVSNESSFGVCTWCHAAQRLGVPPPVSIQNDFSLLDRRFDGELAETCSDINHNLGLLAYGSLAGGTLAGKYSNGERPPGGRHSLFPKFQPRYWCPRSIEAADAYGAIAAKHGLTSAQLALAWAYSRFYMGAVIIGATSIPQLEENIKACEVELSAEVIAEIDAVHTRLRNPNVRD